MSEEKYKIMCEEFESMAENCANRGVGFDRFLLYGTRAFIEGLIKNTKVNDRLDILIFINEIIVKSVKEEKDE